MTLRLQIGRAGFYDALAMLKMGITPRQNAVLQFLRAESERGAPTPSLEQISQALGMRSRSGAHRLVAALEKRGHLIKAPGLKRSMALNPSAPVATVIEGAPVAEIAPPDRAKSERARRRRTYVVELERDVNVHLRRLAHRAGIPPERIIAEALRSYIMEPESDP